MSQKQNTEEEKPRRTDSWFILTVWHPVVVDGMTIAQLAEDWCMETLGPMDENWHMRLLWGSSKEFRFQDREDATAFKLKFKK